MGHKFAKILPTAHKTALLKFISAQKLTAACCRSNASDWLRIRIVRIDKNYTGHVLEEALDNTKGASPLWSLDNKVS